MPRRAKPAPTPPVSAEAGSSARPGLTRAAVVQAAAALLNAEGVEALTINRLARELGIQPPSLYNHIDGMPGLRRELALLNARQLGDCFVHAAVGKSGRAGVIAITQ